MPRGVFKGKESGSFNYLVRNFVALIYLEVIFNVRIDRGLNLMGWSSIDDITFWVV